MIAGLSLSHTRDQVFRAILEGVACGVRHNVETLAHAVRVINEGAEEFRKLGTASSPGTKTFALTGHVANTGLVEVPFGTTLREVVFDIGGGITDRRGCSHPASILKA